MVAAGVYLLARMYGFIALTPTTLGVIALIGGFTALFAATMAVVKREIKQVLAYSTISQYGYIMLALGAGGYVAGVFHLTTHAVFKALLFLGAGSVIVAMHHSENMWEMGGLKDKLPVTYWTFLAGSLALAGIFPFAGFWSKDEVLYEALIYGTHSPLLLVGYAFGLVAVFITGFYTIRMVTLTFHGSPRSDAASDPHSVRWNIKAPLVVLGILAVIGGVINMKPVADVLAIDIEFLSLWLDQGLTDATAHHYHDLFVNYAGYEAGEISSVLVAIVSLVFALAGAGLWFDASAAVQIAAIWAGHIGADRAFGFGLKFPTGFRDTHLGGQPAPVTAFTETE
jgi:NADH-quinone oxidoreductase subunit L